MDLEDYYSVDTLLKAYTLAEQSEARATNTTEALMKLLVSSYIYTSISTTIRKLIVDSNKNPIILNMHCFMFNSDDTVIQALIQKAIIDLSIK